MTNKIVEFIILDDQPLLVMENVGFQHLIEHLEPQYSLPDRKHISETALPKKYKTVSEHISCFCLFIYFLHKLVSAKGIGIGIGKDKKGIGTFLLEIVYTTISITKKLCACVFLCTHAHRCVCV